MKAPIVIQPHATERHLRIVGVRCQDGSIRALGCGETDRDVLAAALQWEGGLWVEEAAELLGCDRARALRLLDALRRDRRAYRWQGGALWRGGREREPKPRRGQGEDEC